MSAENDKPTGRLVWLPEDLAITIFAALHAHRPRYLDEFCAAWDAAPADPAEAVAVALEEADGRATLNTTIFDIADAVLAALGAPKATP